MDRAKVNGVELEYEVRGAGEPVLLIDMLLPDSFVPFLSEAALADRYQLIRYHKRGWVGSTHTPGPVSIREHAADAAAFLQFLGVNRAHIVGHSSGAAIGAQLTIDHAELVQTLTLLEPTFTSLPAGRAFVQGAGPVFEAYGDGDHAGAIAMFVSRRQWSRMGTPLGRCSSSGFRVWSTQSIKDADTFFGSRCPPSPSGRSGPAGCRHSQHRSCPSSARTPALWVEIAEFLRSSLPNVEEATIDGVGHLLQIQRPEPVARRWRSS